MICLAFDLATTTGFAVGDFRGEPVFGSQLLGKPGSKHGARFSQAFLLTKKLILEHNPDLITIEQAIPAGPKGGQERAQMAYGYRAAVHMAAFNLGGVRIEEYAISSIRSFFIKSAGTGAKAKAITMEHCMSLGWDVDNDNESDALALWCLAGEKAGQRRTRPYGGLL